MMAEEVAEVKSWASHRRGIGVHTAHQAGDGVSFLVFGFPHIIRADFLSQPGHSLRKFSCHLNQASPRLSDKIQPSR